MTRGTNARSAGATYIAASVASMFLFANTTTGGEPRAQLARLAAHAADVRLTTMLGSPCWRSESCSRWGCLSGVSRPQ